ncbi:major facilitator superfamily domain-containing protein 6-A [Sergentomyia squamirostris]
MEQLGEDYGDGEYDQYGQQRAPPKHYQAARPMVDPEAAGEVDPSLYPQAKESTHKIRGRYDVIEMIFGPVDQELLFVKTFYFFFYSAFGSLFPLMGVYFKQMGMNPGQCGLLIGIRPFVEFLSAPFWGSYADRFKKGKMLLLASLSCWILFTLPLGFIQPPATSCLEKRNESEYELKVPQAPRILKRSLDLSDFAKFSLYDGVNEPRTPRSHDHRDASSKITSNNLSQELEEGFRNFENSVKEHNRQVRAVRPPSEAGQSPLDVRYASNYNAKIHGSWVSPLFSSIVYRTEDIQKAFFLLILLVIIGEFFAAPAITLADSAVITILGDDADRYGHQRMFGSLGWGLAMFFVGIALDHSTAFPDHPCGPEKEEKNYTICFATFSVLMGAALITATQINFKYDYEEAQSTAEAPGEAKPSAEDEMQNQLAAQLQLPSLAAPTKPAGSSLTSDLGAQTKMFAQTTREMPEWITVLKQFKNLKCASFLFVAWFMGFGIGLIFTFLFWHLQDYGGSPTLFGMASVINHISEIFAYFFSFRLITQIGHVKVLCLGLVGNILRFLYISYLKNPWWVLPFEFMQGITHAAVWAACCSYIAHNTPQPLRTSAQGVLQGLHHGLGRGCGAVIGGIFVTYFGTTATFRGYGICCIFILAAFIFINFYRKEQGFVSDIPTTEDPRQVAEETSHLAPHGVPSNPIPRALSSTRLNDIGSVNSDNYGSAAYQSTGGNLDIPGGSQRNPFYQQQ